MVLAVKLLEMPTDGAIIDWCDQPLSWKHSFFFCSHWLVRVGFALWYVVLLWPLTNNGLNVCVGWVQESSHSVSNCESQKKSIRVERQKNIRVQRQWVFFVHFKCDK